MRGEQKSQEFKELSSRCPSKNLRGRSLCHLMEVSMALDKSLVLTQNTKEKAPTNPLVARRNRLITIIKNQLVYVEQEKMGQLPHRAYRRLARWWWQEGTSYFLSIQYCRLPMELAKGKFSVQCQDIEGVAQALRAVEKAVAAGDYDSVMGERAARTKNNFSQRKKAA
jgi:acyl-CoA synthetase (AMP-forming)/AMP-acid ligase II